MDENTTTTTTTEATTTTTIVANINISKQDIHGTEVAGATLVLTGTDRDGNAVNFSADDVEFGYGAEFVSDGAELTWISGMVNTLIKNLPDGTYVLHETTAPDGFEVSADIRFTIRRGHVIGHDDDTVIMVDTRIGEVRISKSNVYGDELPGATLTLTGTDADGNSITFDSENIILGKGAQLVTADESGFTWISGSRPTFISNLPDGTYVLHEEAAPNGYKIASDITFTVDDGDIIGESEVSGNIVTMVDDMISTDITISKENILGNELAGATLTLTGTDITGRDVEFNVDDVTVGADGELISGGHGLAWISGSEATSIRNLADGTYVLHEVSAPNGYEITTDITFTISNGVVSGEVGVDGNDITMVDDFAVTDVEISKVNIFGSEIAGATLTLTGTHADGGSIEFSVDDVVIGENGQLVSTENTTELRWISGITSTMIKNLPDGTYVLHEVAAPNGYQVATDITFTITNGILTGEVGVSGDSVTMVDDMSGTDVYLSKENVFGSELAGATLTLTGTDFTGHTVEFTQDSLVLGEGAGLVGSGSQLTWTSGTTASMVKNLPNGTYVLHEVAAPNGYQVATDITFTVTDGVVTGEVGVEGDSVTMVDDMLTTDVTISKVNVSGEEIAGATLTLTGKDFLGNTIEFTQDSLVLGESAGFVSSGDELTWTSGTKTTLVKNLPDGTYVLHEVTAPNGYQVATDITFTIENGVLTGEVGVSSDSVTMVDDMTVTDVTISKQDIAGKELNGASLTLTGTDFNGNAVEFTQDSLVLGEGAALTSAGTELAWISGKTSSLVKNLPDGTYVLHEVAAPDGYAVATDITFTIASGVIVGSVGVEGTTVTMIDKRVLAEVEISKQDVLGEELAGAELTLSGVDADGNDITFDLTQVVLGTGAKLVTEENGKTLTWISGTSSTFISELADGTYVLHEVAAPDGYAVATDIKFTVTNGVIAGEVSVDGNTVTMIDEKIVTTSTTTRTTHSTAAATTRTTRTTAATTTYSAKTNAPKTGDIGVGVTGIALAVAAMTAFSVRRKREDEE
ncbi:MAG: hypothetical protein K2J26_00065 [Ruminococcus sp.]|nr:hypothetical protein [Ruminococcus sp.]